MSVVVSVSMFNNNIVDCGVGVSDSVGVIGGVGCHSASHFMSTLWRRPTDRQYRAARAAKNMKILSLNDQLRQYICLTNLNSRSTV